MAGAPNPTDAYAEAVAITLRTARRALEARSMTSTVPLSVFLADCASTARRQAIE